MFFMLRSASNSRQHTICGMCLMCLCCTDMMYSVGTIDMDMITTGRTAVDRDLILKLADQVMILPPATFTTIHLVLHTVLTPT
jgi:hypothetical protein